MADIQAEDIEAVHCSRVAAAEADQEEADSSQLPADPGSSWVQVSML